MNIKVDDILMVVIVIISLYIIYKIYHGSLIEGKRTSTFTGKLLEYTFPKMFKKYTDIDDRVNNYNKFKNNKVKNNINLHSVSEKTGESKPKNSESKFSNGRTKLDCYNYLINAGAGGGGGSELESYCGTDMEYTDTSCKGRLSLSFLEGGLVEGKCDGMDYGDDCGTQYDYEGYACVEDNKNGETKCIKGEKCSSGNISDLTLEQLNHNLQVLQNLSANFSAIIDIDGYDACDEDDEDDQACMSMKKFFKEFHGETIKNNIKTINKIIGEIGEIIDIRKSEEQTDKYNNCTKIVGIRPYLAKYVKCCNQGDEGDKKCQEMGAGNNCVSHNTYGSVCVG